MTNFRKKGTLDIPHTTRAEITKANNAIQGICKQAGTGGKEPDMKKGCLTSRAAFDIKIYVDQSFSFAQMNSRFKRAILVIETFFGHSASQAPVLVQLPKPNSSIRATIAFARREASIRP